MKNECFDIEGSLLLRPPTHKLLNSDLPAISSSKFSLLQNSSRLAKVFSFLSLIECKLNSYIRLVYSTSMYEISLFFLSIFLFVSLPSQPISLFYFLIIVFHFAKAITGLVLLNCIPKTYQMCEHFTWEVSHQIGVGKNVKEVGNESDRSNENQKNLLKAINTSSKSVITSGLVNSRCWIMTYFILNVLALCIDIYNYFSSLFLLSHLHI